MHQSKVIVPVLAFVSLALVFLVRSVPVIAAPVGTIQLTVDCGAKLEKTTITNMTNEELLMTGWTLGSVVRPSGGEPYPLSGKLAPGAQITYTTGPDAIPGRLTLKETKLYDRDDPLEGAVLETPYGTVRATCIGRVGILRLGPTATPQATQIVTAAPTFVPVAQPIATSTPAPVSQTFAWLDRPPLSANPAPSCPPAGQWFLVYAGGRDGTPVSSAANACPNVDILWVSRGGKWFGYAKSTPDASDSWDVGIGEAHFVRGQ